MYRVPASRNVWPIPAVDQGDFRARNNQPVSIVIPASGGMVVQPHVQDCSWIAIPGASHEGRAAGNAAEVSTELVPGMLMSDASECLLPRID